MGGCRCTYRNCNVKSDGKTHMFHFPVFDKVRCHQWLVNAQRLEFLNLKVSQLKNRCICQHHFKTENFMNFKKDKLTFDAVPTLDGPYCDPSKGGFRDTKKTYPNLILVEDIENDFDINDKKSNFSVKYADFLTNNEFVDSSARYNRNKINQTEDNTSVNLNTTSNIKDNDKTFEPYYTKLELPTKKKKKIAPHQIMLVPQYSDFSNELRMGKELNLEQNLTDLQSNSNLQNKRSNAEFGIVSSSAQLVDIAPNYNQDLSDPLKMGTQQNLEQNLTDPLSNLNLEDKCSKQENMSIITSVSQSVESVDTATKYKELMLKRRPKVKILSEKKIKDPINIGQIAGEFKIISPSRPLSLPDKSHIISKNEEPEIIPKSLTVESDIKPSEKLKILEVLNVQFEPETMKAGPFQNDVKKENTDKIEKIAPKSPPKKSTPVKNKITPERSAAIEKKRKFNMKLKDIIETCLDKPDDPLKNHEISPSLINNLEKPPVNTAKESIKPLVKAKRKQPAEKVVSHLAEDKNLPNIQDYTIAYLEERMKKMESTLLNKIAQNSQQIIDFKNTLTKDSSHVGKKRKEQSNKRVASTQTNESESSYKKFLYQEISKYLSPSSNSVIYEELFINKFVCDKVENPSKRKRRKCI